MELFMTIETKADVDDILGAIFWETKCQLAFITDKEAGLEEVDNYGTEFPSYLCYPDLSGRPILGSLRLERTQTNLAEEKRSGYSAPHGLRPVCAGNTRKPTVNVY